MPVSTTASQLPYVSNGVNRTFPFPYHFSDASQLVVTIENAGTVEDTLTLGADYAVSGSGPSGGTVVLTTAATSGRTVRIRRLLPLTQGLSLSTQGPFSPSAITEAIDDLTLKIQQVNDGVVTANALYDFGLADAGAGSVTATGAITARTLAARFADSLNVKDFGAVGDGVVDDTDAIQAAAAQAAVLGAGDVVFPAGDYAISEPIACATSGVHFRGAGPGATTVKVLAGFSGTACFILGNKSTTTVTTNIRLEGMTLDCDNRASISGFEAYGLRDGSGFADVYVANNTGVPGIVTGQAGAGAGQASSRMCEGMQFRNCWVIGGPWSSSCAIALDGIFESQMLGGGVRGFSVTDNTSAVGIRVGNYAEARAVHMIGPTVVMLKENGDGSGKSNAGIQYGIYARDCSDTGSTFEGITGKAVLFSGSAASNGLPFNCRSVGPRLYVYAQGSDDGFGHEADNFLSPAFVFGVATDCRVENITGYSTFKQAVQFLGEGANGQSRNRATISTSIVPASLSPSFIAFETGCATTNRVDGLAGGWYFTLTSESLGGQHTNDATWAPTFRLGSTNAGRWVDKDDNALLEMTSQWIIPRVPLRNIRVTQNAYGYGATVTPNMALGAVALISPTDTSAFTIAAPTNAATGDVLTITIRNIAGGNLGNVSWNAAYKVAGANPWTLTDGSTLSKPATGFSRSISFRYDGTIWRELWRTPGDVPN